MRIFWWANFVYIILWWIGATGFYLLQCQPVQWYFLQYFARYGKPVPGGYTGQCNATSVLHVALPVIFSLLSDVGLMVLPIWAISRLNMSRKRKYGLLAVFGVGAIACMLELGRILYLILDTDDKADPSCEWANPLSLGLSSEVPFQLMRRALSPPPPPGGVAIFLILTAAIETAAVVCACLPVIGPQVVRLYRRKDAAKRSAYPYYGDSAAPSSKRSARLRNWRSRAGGGHGGGGGGFTQFGSLNHITDLDETINYDRTHDDDGGREGDDEVELAGIAPGHHQDARGSGDDWQRVLRAHAVPGQSSTRTGALSPPQSPGQILVRTDVEVEVGFYFTLLLIC